MTMRYLIMVKTTKPTSKSTCGNFARSYSATHHTICLGPEVADVSIAGYSVFRQDRPSLQDTRYANQKQPKVS